jgi:hypothetical protein
MNDQYFRSPYSDAAFNPEVDAVDESEERLLPETYQNELLDSFEEHDDDNYMGFTEEDHLLLYGTDEPVPSTAQIIWDMFQPSYYWVIDTAKEASRLFTGMIFWLQEDATFKLTVSITEF